MRYEPRHTEIDAVQWLGDIDDVPLEWREAEAIAVEEETGDLIVPTHNGPSHARVGDYVARCSDGEVYPIRKHRFHERWQAVKA